MVKINLKKLYKVITIGVILFIGFFNSLNASTLVLAPEGGTYHVGDVISVKVLVVSQTESINAVSSKISFTKDTLVLNSISKSGSVISIWAQEPTFSNTAGIASFEGVLLSGYTGSGATVSTLKFKAKSVGNASIKFNYGAVLANDGEGTNTLKSTNEANFSILKAEEKPKQKETPIKQMETVIKEAVTTKVEDTSVAPLAPIIKYYVNDFNPIFIYLVIILGLISGILLWLYLRYRFYVKKKLEKMKELSEYRFNILKDDEKEKTLRILNRDMNDTEKIIEDSINDIEKM